MRWAAIFYLVFTVALGVVSESSMMIRDPVYGDKELRLRRCEAAVGPAGIRVVMLGTSRTGYAFDGRRIAKHIQAATGRPAVAFNFGIPASGPITHKLYLERLLRDGHRPDLLVLEVLPSSLAIREDGPVENHFLAADRLAYAEVEEAIGYGFPARASRTRWWQSVLNPWYTLRFQIMGRAVNTWLPWQVRHDAGRTTDDHGWMVPLNQTATEQQKEHAFDRARVEYSVVLGNMTPGGGSGQAFGELLDLAAAHGIPVKVIILPESPRFRTMYHPHVEERVVRYLQEECGRHRVDWIEARHWLPEDAFYDGHHMTRAGSEAFSDRLSKDLIVPFFHGN